MSQAQKNFGRDLTDFVDNNGDARVDGIEINQDWEAEATIIKFEDGSALQFSGPDCSVVTA